MAKYPQEIFVQLKDDGNAKWLDDGNAKWLDAEEHFEKLDGGEIAIYRLVTNKARAAVTV